MADEKRNEVTTGPAAEVPRDSDAHSDVYVDRPNGWIYRGFRFRGKEIWYASPTIQLLMVSLVCFMCPGMFNALSGLGGGGQVDARAQQYANTALYGVFAVVGFFSGTIANVLGLRLTLSFGGLGYALYAASFLAYNHIQSFAFVVFAGCFLGVCAGLLWTAQGAIMMAYPPEKLKGRYISWFWIIFNMGGVIGSLIPLAQNINKTSGAVTDGTYAGLIVLMFIGLILAMFLVNADKVIREDGTKVILMKNPSWKTEFIGLWETLYQDPWIILLFPMFFASNIFYTYQTNGVNAIMFNIRTRSLNGLLYWLSQIVGAIVFGYALDFPNVRRSLRAKISFVVLAALTMAIWGGGYAWQSKQVSRAEASTDEYKANHLVDWTDGGEKYIGPMFLYFFYGFYDAVWQTCMYWYMGALSNSGRKAANLAGFYKGLQSLGACIFFALDSQKISYDTLFTITWAILGASLVVGAPVILSRIKDTVSVEEDLKFSDETIEDVVVGVDDKRAGTA